MRHSDSVNLNRETWFLIFKHEEKLSLFARVIEVKQRGAKAFKLTVTMEIFKDWYYRIQTKYSQGNLKVRRGKKNKIK